MDQTTLIYPDINVATAIISLSKAGKSFPRGFPIPIVISITELLFPFPGKIRITGES